MPRLVKADQRGRFAEGRKHGNQWPRPSIWGTGPGAERALERWFAWHMCDGTCDGICARYRRLTRMHAAYGRRKR